MSSRSPKCRFLRSLLVSSLLACSSAAFAQTEHEAHQDIQATYDFDPPSLTTADAAHTARSLSGLWARYAAEPGPYRSALRAELLTPGQREALYCDGGLLLLSKSAAAEDQSLGLAAIRKCSMAEVQQTAYFRTMHAMAVRGLDTLEWQLPMLTKPSYTVAFEAPALRLGQDIAFAYPLLLQDEKRYVPRLIERLRKEQDPIAQKSLVRTLWYAATREAQVALRQFASRPSAAVVAKDEAQKLLARVSQERKWPPNHDSLLRIRKALDVSATTSQASLRALRRTRMQTVSADALRDLEGYTTLLYRAAP